MGTEWVCYQERKPRVHSLGVWISGTDKHGTDDFMQYQAVQVRWCMVDNAITWYSCFVSAAVMEIEYRFVISVFGPLA